MDLKEYVQWLEEQIDDYECRIEDSGPDDDVSYEGGCLVAYKRALEKLEGVDELPDDVVDINFTDDGGDYEIVVRGSALASHYEDNEEQGAELVELTGGKLEELDGIECDDVFSEYFPDEPWARGVTGGLMRFEYDSEKLYTITTYQSTRALSEDELHELKEYTVGQWSDGIGECFEQKEVPGHDGMYISPWHEEQLDDTITQVRVDGKD